MAVPEARLARLVLEGWERHRASCSDSRCLHYGSSADGNVEGEVRVGSAEVGARGLVGVGAFPGGWCYLELALRDHRVTFEAFGGVGILDEIQESLGFVRIEIVVHGRSV